MYDLEPSAPCTPHRTRVSLVPCLSLARRIFEDDIAELEYADRQGVRAVFADGFKEPWEEGRAHNLEFEGFWIGDFDCEGTGVGAVHERKVFLVRALLFLLLF